MIVNEVLLARCRMKKRLRSREDQVSFMAQCKPETPKLLEEIKQVLGKHYQKAKLETLAWSRSMIMLRFK